MLDGVLVDHALELGGSAEHRQAVANRRGVVEEANRAKAGARLGLQPASDAVTNLAGADDQRGPLAGGPRPLAVELSRNHETADRDEHDREDPELRERTDQRMLESLREEKRGGGESIATSDRLPSTGAMTSIMRTPSRGLYSSRQATVATAANGKRRISASEAGLSPLREPLACTTASARPSMAISPSTSGSSQRRACRCSSRRTPGGPTAHRCPAWRGGADAESGACRRSRRGGASVRSAGGFIVGERCLVAPCQVARPPPMPLPGTSPTCGPSYPEFCFSATLRRP